MLVISLGYTAWTTHCPKSGYRETESVTYVRKKVTIKSPSANKLNQTKEYQIEFMKLNELLVSIAGEE